MCLHPEEIPPIPNETVRVAKAAFPKGNLYMRLRDELGVFYQDDSDFLASIQPSITRQSESHQISNTTNAKQPVGLPPTSELEILRDGYAAPKASHFVPTEIR
ncbi:MAG: hypothetical protein V7K77_02800 [Nostoc sp.]|uniref:hypothetical protein n=1 Tax=Nostoc sp. TaxID=1180 RepID=UPI002FF45D05